MENQIRSSTNNQPVALVTGANQGVGFQIAIALAVSGYNVYVSDRVTTATGKTWLLTWARMHMPLSWTLRSLYHAFNNYNG